MQDSTQTTTLVTPTNTLYLAIASFLARYSNERTRSLYELDLRLFTTWCASHGLDPLVDVQRPHLELFARHLEVERHNQAASVARRLTTLRQFYAICEIDQLVPKSPATYVKIPTVYRDETKTLGLDRMELGALVQTARAADPTRAALVSLLGLMGLRVSEACAVQVDDFAHVERGHRVLKLVGKGNKPATAPIPVPVARTLDLCAGDRTEGPLLLRADGQQLDRRTADRWIKSLAKRAGIKKRISPHSLRHSYVTNALDAGVPLRDVQIGARHSDPRTTSRYDRARGNLDRHANHTLAAFIAGAA